MSNTDRPHILRHVRSQEKEDLIFTTWRTTICTWFLKEILATLFWISPHHGGTYHYTNLSIAYAQNSPLILSTHPNDTRTLGSTHDGNEAHACWWRCVATYNLLCPPYCNNGILNLLVYLRSIYVQIGWSIFTWQQCCHIIRKYGLTNFPIWISHASQNI